MECACAVTVYTFRKNSSSCPRNFEEQNKVLEPSIIIINFIIIVIINAYYNYNFIINSQYNYDGDRGSSVVKVLYYKSEGCWFDPIWCNWNFSFT